MDEQLKSVTETRRRGIALQLSEISKKVEGRYQGEMHWGHAGDLDHILNALKEINKFLGQ